MSGIPPSNLRPFGAPPSIGRRECPREPLPWEGAAERSEAGLASFWGGARVLVYRLLETISPLFFIPLVPYPSLRGTFPSRGRLCIGDSGTLANGVLETISPLSFIPLVPYPARFARHLPLEGEGFMSGTATLAYTMLLRRSPALFYTASTLSAPSGHLPLEGKALCLGQQHSHKCRASILCKQKPLCENGLCRAVSGSIIPRSRILRDFSAYPHHFLS